MSAGRERSGDSSGGWLNHYQRMKRWESRAQSVAVRTIATQTHDAIDFALAYFVWAHSFREWLIETNTATRSQLNVLLDGRSEWRLCRDIANRCRHYNLTKNPTDNDFVVSVRIDLNALLAGRTEQVMPGVFHGGQHFDFHACINDISRMWEEVIDELKLRGPTP